MDYRFKISGNTRPFRVQLYSGTTISAANEVKDIAVDYSGTCVVLNNLKEFTDYTLSLNDGIAQSGSFNFSTTPLGAQATPDVLPIVTFGIIGTPTQPSGPIPGTVCYVPTPKTLSINPPLGANDCACVCAEVCLDDGGDDIINDVKFYKSCNGGGYNYLIGYSTNGCRSLPAIDMGQNDSICYTLSSTYGGSGTGVNQGCAEIKIVDVTSKSGTFNTEIDSATSAITTNINYEVTTTTTTTTEAPIVLSFKRAAYYNESTSCEWTLTSGIETSRALVDGECVQICFTNTVFSCAGQYAEKIYANACWRDNYNNRTCGAVSTCVSRNVINNTTDSTRSSIIITPENQDSIAINFAVSVDPSDMEKLVCARASTLFDRLDKCIGANFSWGGTSNVLNLTKRGTGAGELIREQEPTLVDDDDTTTIREEREALI